MHAHAFKQMIALDQKRCTSSGKLGVSTRHGRRRRSKLGKIERIDAGCETNYNCQQQSVKAGY
ncbi:MAG TPA: hypothetical protein VGE85_03035 [Terracidiphilus sp.]|jgi:hypothetical protein